VIGTRLGPYEITAKLGEGGMGEVYRATDSKLKREVAIKVLPAAFTEDKERLARFEREAQLLAQLHHPNIASIFGLEESGGVQALVMELVEGPTLAERLASGPPPLEEVLSVAKQIAEALEEAHEKGIVHRDLKPQNIKVTADGKVKVLDFGLAKALDPVAGSSAADLARSPTIMNSPTLTSAGTQLGVILGTAAYMAPEQARGGAVDKRADIWAFGVVLYEMLSGKSLFSGPTVSDTLAGVLKTEIEWRGVRPETPAAIRALLRRCLERNPKNRLHDIADARIVLDEVLSGKVEEPSTLETSRAAGTAPQRGRMLALGVLWLALGAAGGWLLHPRSTAPAPPASRLALALPEGYSLSTDDRPQLALSRDGRLQVAVVVGKNASSQLLVRRSDEFEPQLLAGTEGATSPFFSPDGAWVAYFRDDALIKVPIGGGPPVRLATVVNGGRGGTWSSDGYIYFAPDFATSLSRVAENGGEVREVTQLDGGRSERTHRWPEALPQGDAVLFTCDTLSSTEYYDDARIEVVRPATGERKVLVEGASQARYAPGGHLVFARGGALFAVAFDPKTLEVRGSPRQVAQGVATNVGSGAVQFAIAQNGAALWAPGGLAAAYRIVWVDRNGVESPVDIPQATYNELGLSPDGSRLALIGGQGGASDLWVADLRRGVLTRLTSGDFTRSPVWTADGTRIAYAVLSRGAGENRGRIDWRPADGSRVAETLVPEGGASFPSSFTPDGRMLIYDQTDSGTGLSQGNVWTVPLVGERRARALTEGPFGKYAGIVSPDGKWLAYVSTEGGPPSVYVRPYPQGDGRWQISIPRGDEPRWSPDGRELFYRADSVLYRVTIDTSHGFSAARPAPFLDRVASGGEVQSYALSPDGSRILTVRTAEGSGAQRTLDLDLGFARRLDEPGNDGR
jgi:serine/threonine-protein kinase